jgi:hypothetical protein
MKIKTKSVTPRPIKDGVVSTLASDPLAVCGAVSDSVNGIPNKYKDFYDIFKKRNADRLLKHRRYDYQVDL